MLSASQASLSSTMDQTSQPSSSSTTVRLGGRIIDRHNPIIRDGRRGLESCEKKHVSKRKLKKGESEVAAKSPIGCSSVDTPQSSSRCLLSNPVFFDGFVDSDPIPIPIDEPEITRADDLVKFHEEDQLIINASKHLPSTSSSSFLEKKQPDFFDGFLDYEPVLSPDNPFSEPTKASPTASLSSLEDRDISSPEDKDISSPDFKFFLPPPPPPPPPPSVKPREEKNSSSDQVVVLKVSLHCKGCAGKVKKHLSKLKGVTSYDIDFAAKRVTVTGDVTPLTVLATISKVKNAQFWP